MRKVLAALTVIAASLLLAPVSPATSAPAGGADRADRTPSARGVASFRREVITLTNAKRAAHGCPALVKNRALSKAAQSHTKRMANTGRGGTLSHQLPGEASFGTRFRRAGYRGATLIGENVASGYATPAAVLDGWMHSAPHRRNILTCRYQHIGVGYATADNGTAYWTQDFGRK
jgi:uncharacterized protein YkwD